LIVGGLVSFLLVTVVILFLIVVSVCIAEAAFFDSALWVFEFIV
jgi:hypothetical protein